MRYRASSDLRSPQVNPVVYLSYTLSFSSFPNLHRPCDSRKKRRRSSECTNENKCRYSTLTHEYWALADAILSMGGTTCGPCVSRRTRSSGASTSEIVRLLVHWPLTERHVHFCIDLRHFCGFACSIFVFNLSLSLSLFLPFFHSRSFFVL